MEKSEPLPQTLSEDIALLVRNGWEVEIKQVRPAGASMYEILAEKDGQYLEFRYEYGPGGFFQAWTWGDYIWHWGRSSATYPLAREEMYRMISGKDPDAS